MMEVMLLRRSRRSAPLQGWSLFLCGARFSSLLLLLLLLLIHLLHLHDKRIVILLHLSMQFIIGFMS
jgi:hypothetical protein